VPGVPDRLRTLLCRPLLAAAVLLAAYVGLSFLNNTHGYLGTDTGGKTATLEAMERSNSFDPDVGYWAKQWDPDAKFHPLFYTSRVGDRYINVTTLPVVVAAEPLWRIGGYRLALLLPMLGSIGTAFAARAIADRIVAGRGWAAFWITGLASAATIYALDFWEHSIGLALIGWAMVALLEVHAERASVRNSLLAGLAFGAAFTMRTEAAVYAFVALAVICLLVLQRTRSIIEPLRIGLAAMAGAAIPFLLNVLLERALLGQGLRASRTASAAAGGGTTLGTRLREGLTTTFSLSGSDSSAILLGALIIVMLGYLAAKAIRGEQVADGGVLVVLGALSAGLYVFSFASHGFGFIPGFAMVTPFAAVAAARAWPHPQARVIVAISLLALPVVWLFQFSGGAVPQWGGRYVLTSALLLGAVGVALADRVHRAVVGLLVAIAVFATFVGVGWLIQRSDAIDGVRRDLASRPEPALISDIGFWLRELGPEALDHKWLSVANADEVDDAAKIVSDAGIDEVAVLSLDVGSPRQIDGWSQVRADHYRWLGVDFRVVTYNRR
jgi:hypothetical protein